MTALEKYARLEALGLWREAAATDPREVVVSFGNASLVLTDLSDRPLGHWALAGIEPVGRAEGATIYAMDRAGDETLTIRDPEMIAAIAAVSRDWSAIPVPVQTVARRRFPWVALLALIVLAVLAAQLPRLVRDQAARMVPPEQAQEFGQRMLLDLIAAHGSPCTDPAGLRALGRLSERAAGGLPLTVLDLGQAPPVSVLPGPAAVINLGAIKAAPRPQVLAAQLGHALGPDPMRAPVRALMEAAGPLASLRYILTGALSDAALARGADRAVLPPPSDALPAPIAAAVPVLSDRDWAALGAICR